MSTAYIIYDKYANAINNELLETGRRDSIHIDAVRLALRLALAELAESTPSTPSMPAGQDSLHAQIVRLTEWLALNVENQHMASVDLVIHEIERQRTALATYQAEIDHLQEDANAEVAKLEQQLAQLDADNAALIRRNKELSDELKHARLDRQESAFSGISATITDHPNGTAVTIAPAPINHQITLDYSSLSSENVDWCDGLDADRQQWRHLPKRTRLELVRWILSHDAAMTMAAFDAIRPEWMPTAGSHCKTFNMTWEQLNDFTVDLEVTR